MSKITYEQKRKIGLKLYEFMDSFLNDFSAIDGTKILVHGGGKAADELASRLNIKQTISGRMCLICLIFIPPLVVAIVYPHIFLTMLEYAGGIGCALLLGLLPILMVWRGRYHLDFKGIHQLFGGKRVLAILAVFVTCEVVFELLRVQSKLIAW